MTDDDLFPGTVPTVEDAAAPMPEPAPMLRWALIEAGAVSTVTESESQPDTFGGTWVECPGHVGPGWTYDGAEFSAPVVVAAPRLISVGAFKKRLGMDALAIANSTDEVCVALREMLYDQPHVDLDGDVGMFLNMLIDAEQPEARPRFPGSGPMTPEKRDAILSAPVRESERP